MKKIVVIDDDIQLCQDVGRGQHSDCRAPHGCGRGLRACQRTRPAPASPFAGEFFGQEPISPPAIIEQVAGTLYKGSDILHTVTVADDLFPVEADPRQIRQVFENLLTNAKEAMAQGGTVKIDMENYQVDSKNILPLASGSYLRIALQDNGVSRQRICRKYLIPIFRPRILTAKKGWGWGCRSAMPF